MEKIKNPFQKFLNNLILGLCLILAVFVASPLTKIAIDKTWAQDYSYNFYVYGYNEDGTISECDTKKYTTGLFTNRGQYYEYNNKVVDLYTGDSNPKDYTSAIRKENEKGEVTNDRPGGASYGTTYTAQSRSSGVYVVGFFSSSTFSPQSAISFGNQITLNSQTQIYILLAKSKYELNITTNAYLLVQDKTTSETISWMSNYIGKSVDETVVPLGGEYTFTLDEDYNDYNCEWRVIDERQQKVATNITAWSKEMTYNVYYLNGELILRGPSWTSWQANHYAEWTSKKGVTQDYQFYATPNQGELDKVTLSNKTVTFKIDNARRLQKFADEVGDKEMNKALIPNGYKYKAVLENNIESYYGDPIGIDNEDGAFKGSFDGQGHTIGTARLNLTKISELKESKRDYTGSEYYQTNYAGFFGYVDGQTGNEIKNVTINNISFQSIINGFCTYSYDSGFTYKKLIFSRNLDYFMVANGNIGGFVGYGQNVAFSNITIGNVKYSAKNDIPHTKNYLNGNFGSFAGKLDSCNIENVNCGNAEISIDSMFDLSSGDNMAFSSRGNFYAGAIGELVSNGSRVETFKVGNLSLTIIGNNTSISTTYDDVFIGGFCGKSKNYSISNVTIDNFKYEFTSNTSGNENSKYVLAGGNKDSLNGCVGAGIGYFAGTSTNCITNFEIKNSTIDSNFAHFVNIGGFVGCIDKSAGKISNIKIYNSKTTFPVTDTEWEGLNGKRQNLYFGGFVGQIQNSSISFENCLSTINSLTINKFIAIRIWDDNSYTHIGGLLGTGEATFNNCGTVINWFSAPCRATRTNQKTQINLLIDFFVSSDTGLSGRNNFCYIGEVDLKNFTGTKVVFYTLGGFKDNSNNRNNYGVISKFAGTIENNSCSIEVRDYKRENSYAYLPLVKSGEISYKAFDKTVGLSTGGSANNYVGFSSAGNKYGLNDGTTHLELTSKILNFGLDYSSSVSAIYGYNGNIQKVDLSSTDFKSATPFLLSHYDDFTHIIINCEGYSVKEIDSRFVYGEKNGEFYKNAIATALPNRQVYLPEMTNSSGIKCSGYRERGNPGVIYKTYSSILTSVGAGQKTIVLEPIFTPAVTLYSLTPLVCKDEYKSGNRTFKLYKVGGNTGDSIYNYCYRFEETTPNSTYNSIPSEALEKIEVENNSNKEYKLGFSDKKLPKTDWVARDFEKSLNKLAEYISGLYSYTTNMNVYVHPYKKVSFHYSNSHNLDSAIYNKLQQIFLIAGDLANKNGTQIIYEPNIFTDFVNDLNDDNGNKIALFSGYFSNECFDNKINTIDTVSGTLVLKNGGSLNISDFERDNLYAVYGLKGVIKITYQNSDGSSLFTQDINYTSTPTFNGGLLLNCVRNEDIVIKNYNDLVKSPNYAFVSWKISAKIDGTDITQNFYIYPGKLGTLKVPALWVSNAIEGNNLGKTIEIKLTPVFVQKNGVDLVINKVLISVFSNLKFTYQISSPEDLILMSYNINHRTDYRDGTYSLTKNIDMKDYTNFLPIGFWDNANFYGNFKGNDFSISNFTIESKTFINHLNIVKIDDNGTLVLASRDKKNDYSDKNSESYTGTFYNHDSLCHSTTNLGLFGFISKKPSLGSTNNNQNSVENFNLTNFTIEINNPQYVNAIIFNVGSVAGKTIATIERIVATGLFKFNNSSTSTINLGGIVGILSNGKVSECATKVKINKNKFILDKLNDGGLVGEASGTGVIINSFNLKAMLKLNEEQVGDGIVKTRSGSLQNIYTENKSKYASLNANVMSEVKNEEDRIENIFFSKVDKNIWTRDNSRRVNGGKPYLKNAGTVEVNYFISNDYVKTIEDKSKFNVLYNSNYISKVNDEFVYTVQYFILDTYGWNSVKELSPDGNAIFNALQGYNFVGYTKDGVRYDSANCSAIFSNKGKYYCSFTPKSFNIVYKTIYNSQEVELSQKKVEFGGEFTLENLNTKQILENLFAKNINGQYISSYSFRIKSNNTYVYYGIEEQNGKYVVKLNGTKIVKLDENFENKYNINLNAYFDGNFEIIAELKPVTYSFTVYDENGDVTGEFNKSYGDRIDGELPTQSREGYEFVGYNYFTNQKSAEFIRLGDNGEFPIKNLDEDYRFNEGNYFGPCQNIDIALYPIFQEITYNVYYYIDTTDFSIENSIFVQKIKYGEELELPSELSEMNIIKYGYTLDNFKNVENEEIYSKGATIYYHYSKDLKLLVNCTLSEMQLSVIVRDINSQEIIEDGLKIGYTIKPNNEINELDFSVENGNLVSAHYLDEIEVSLLDISFGTRISKIEYSNEILFDIQKITSAKDYLDALEKIRNIKLKINASAQLVYSIQSIECSTNNIDATITDYQIGEVEDLFVLAKILKTNPNINVSLQNDINITGYKFNIKNFNGTFNGNGYFINGFTSYDNNSFISKLTGKLENLNFDNVVINGNYDCSGIIENNLGEISNVNVVKGYGKVRAENEAKLGFLVGINEGLVTNCYINAELEIVNDVTCYAGLVCGKNIGQISNISVNGKLTSNSYASMICGLTITKGARIENIVVNGNVSSSKKDLISGYYYDDTNLENSNTIFSNIINYTSLDAQSNLNINFANIINANQVSENVLKDFAKNNKNFVYAQSYNNSSSRLLLKNVGIQLYDILAKTDENTYSENLKIKINNKDINLNENLYIYKELSSGLAFSSQNLNANIKNETNSFEINVLIENTVKTNQFNIKVTIDDEILNETKASFDSLSKSNYHNIVFEISSKSVENINYSFVLESDFDQQEIELIKNSLKISLNGENVDVRFENSADQNVYKIILSKEIKINDLVEFIIDLPDFAILSKNGVQVNNNILVQSRLKKSFTHTLSSLNFNDTYNIKACIEKDILNLTFNLNSSTISSEELETISFNNLEGAIIDSVNKTLKLNITPQNGKYIIPEKLENFFNYENNGKHYKLTKFVDNSNVVVYEVKDNTLTRVNFEEISSNLQVYAMYELVGYTVRISNLNNKAIFTKLNGYTIVDNMAQKVFKYNEQMTVPEIEMKENNEYYLFCFYLFKDTNIALYYLDNKGNYHFSDDYMNEKNISFADENKVINVEPKFSEKRYTVKFMVEEDEEYPAFYGENAKYETLSFSISTVQEKFKEIKTAQKEKHIFTGYVNEFGDEIRYKNDVLEIDDYEILLKPSTFIAQFELKNVKITINFKDNNTSTLLDYDIIENNSLNDYTWNYFNNSIQITVPYKTRNVVLPSVKIKNEEFEFYRYEINNSEYTSTFEFVEDETIINTQVYYHINFYTKNGTIGGYYKNLYTTAFGYYVLARFDEEIVLPSQSQVEKEGWTLDGFKILNNQLQENASLNINGPIDVEFIYSGNFVEVTLDANGSVLPNRILGKYISNYQTSENDTKATFNVLYGTTTSEIKEDLPQLLLDGYMFTGYSFKNSANTLVETVKEKTFVIANFEKISYQIVIYEFNNSKWTTMKYIDENIEFDYMPSNYENFIYQNLSLSEDYNYEFEMPSKMIDLKTEYPHFVEQVGSTYTLKVYAYYVSNVTIIIKGNPNSKIENTTGFLNDEFTGGNEFGIDTTINLSAQKVKNGFVLPIPFVKDELNFANFIGYSINLDGQRVLITDAFGNLNGNLKLNGTINLTQEFEFKSYEFTLKVQEDFEVIKSNGFEKRGNTLVKQIKFDEGLGELPIIKINGYIFKGFYISSNEQYLAKLEDTQVSNENGQIVSEFNILSSKSDDDYIYFENYTPRTLISKFEKDYSKINIKFDKRLGEIDLRDNNGNRITLVETENGFETNVEKSSKVYLYLVVNSKVASYEKTIINGQEHSDEGLVIDTDDSVEIEVVFTPIEFTIKYLLDDKELDLLPNKYTYISENITLPSLNIKGYDFESWYLEKSFVNRREILPTNSIGNMVYFAKLQSKEIEVNVYSNLDNYESILLTKTCKYNELFGNLKLETYQDYKLIGIFTEKDREGYIINEDSLVIFDNSISVYAFYEQKTQNSLSGFGTIDNPYKIKNEEEFYHFVNIINTNDDFNNSSTYFELIENITISEKINIQEFKANFNFNMKVILKKGEISSYDVLSNDGTITKNLGLFNVNSGTISNLVLVSTLNCNLTVETNYGSISGKNYGEIHNCIVYSNVSIASTQNINYNFIANGGTINNCSIVSSKIIINENISSEDNVLSIHKPSNSIVPTVEENVYTINSKQELEYIFSQTNGLYEIVLNKNIDMKGIVLDKIPNIKINGNGYKIENLLVLNSTIFAENIEIYKTAIEDLVFINIENTQHIFETATIDNSYITLSIALNSTLFENLTSKNSYFETKNKLELTKNANCENVYTTNFDIELISGRNLIDSNNVDINFIKDNTIWFMDTLGIMGQKNLPRLIGVGNIAINLDYDVNILALYYNDNPTNIIIVKEPSEIHYILDLIDEEYEISAIIFNDLSVIHSRFENYFVIDKILLENNTNVLKVIATKKMYKITIDLDTENAGQILYDGQLSQKVELEVASGEVIVVEILENSGFRFVGWSDKITSTRREILVKGNLSLTANFTHLIKYDLYSSSDDKIQIQNLLENWNETEFGYTILLAQDEDINNYLPVMTKIEHKFIEYSFENINSYNYKIVPVFELDYVKLNFVYDSQFAKVNVVATKQNSTNYENVSVLKISNEKMYVLRGYEINVLINVVGAYVEQILVNNNLLELDYEALKTTNEISQTLIVDQETEIQIISSIIYKTVTFDYEVENIESLKVNGIQIENNEMQVAQFSILNFEIETINSKVIEKIEILDKDSNVIQTFDAQEKYSYIVSDDITIKIIVKTKKFEVIFRSNLGGKVETDKTGEEVDENSFKLVVDFGENILVSILQEDGYKIQSIKLADGKELKISNYFELSNVDKNLDVTVTFEKLDTWLDLNENGDLKYFVLQTFKGKGTASSPFILSSRYDLLTLAYNVNYENETYLGKYFKLSQKDMTFDFVEHYFNPIGNETTNFEGIILGENLTLKNVKIQGGENVGIFKVLGENAVVKSISIFGEITGIKNVGSICGINNGKIIGVSNNASILVSSVVKDENNTGGICAINNSTIERSYNAGEIDSSANYVAGICATNNGSIENIYNIGKIISRSNNEDYIVAGLVATNSGTVLIGYNSSRVVAYSNITGENLTKIIGTSLGNANDLYFNTNYLTTQNGVGKTDGELRNPNNEIYANWNFSKIWEFVSSNSKPTLKTVYEFSGSVTFNVAFADDVLEEDRYLIVEFTNHSSQSYAIMLTNTNKTVTIKNLPQDTYSITLTSLIGTKINCEVNEVKIDEIETGDNFTINISISNSIVSGYYAKIVI